MALLTSPLAAIIALLGLFFVIGKYHKTGIILGLADMILIVYSLQGFRQMLLDSGKRITLDWFGFGNYKEIFLIYAAFFLIGAVCVLVGAWRRKRGQKA